MKRLLLVVAGLLILVAGGWHARERSLDSEFANQSIVSKINESESGIERSYTHEYRGTFVQLDIDNRTMRLLSHDGKAYLFRIPQQLLDNRDSDVVANTEGQLLEIRWHDGRSSERVVRDYTSNPEVPLNEGTLLLSIRQVRDEE